MAITFPIPELTLNPETRQPGRSVTWEQMQEDMRSMREAQRGPGGKQLAAAILSVYREQHLFAAGAMSSGPTAGMY